MKKSMLLIVLTWLGLGLAAQPYDVYYTGSGEWQSVTWSFDTNNDGSPDSPAGAGIYPKLDGTDKMSDNTTDFNAIKCNSDLFVRIDGDKLPEAIGGSINKPITTLGNIVLFNISDSLTFENSVSCKSLYIERGSILVITGNLTMTSTGLIALGNRNIPEFDRLKVDGDLNGQEIDVEKNSEFEITGNAEIKGIVMFPGTNGIVNGDVTVNKNGGRIELLSGTDPTFGPAELTIDGSISVTVTNTNIIVNQDATLNAGSIASLHALDVKPGGTLNVSGDMTVPAGKNVVIDGTVNVGQTP